MSTYVAIGSVCWDEVDGDEERRLGGSVLFSTRVAQAAGWDAHIVTSGTPELERALRAALPDTKVTVQPSPADTVMWFPREADLGPQAVPTVADPIDLTRSPVELAAADVVHLAPIMGEVTESLIAQVEGARFVGITPQGMLRRRDPDTHRLALVSDPPTWWVRGAHAVVLSESEYGRIMEPIVGPGRVLAVTRGERGCFGIEGTETVDLLGIPLEAVAPTGTIGAGDVFAATLFIGLASGRSFTDAMRGANQRAAAHVGGSA